MPSVMAFMMNVLSTQTLRFNTTSPTPTPMLRSVLDFQEDTTVSVPQSVCGDNPSAIGATDGNDAAPIPRSSSLSHSRDDVGGEGDGVATAMYRNAWSRSKLHGDRRRRRVVYVRYIGTSTTSISIIVIPTTTLAIRQRREERFDALAHR